MSGNPVRFQFRNNDEIVKKKMIGPENREPIGLDAIKDIV